MISAVLQKIVTGSEYFDCRSRPFSAPGCSPQFLLIPKAGENYYDAPFALLE
jgi:hypothetical protein